MSLLGMADRTSRCGQREPNGCRPKPGSSIASTVLLSLGMWFFGCGASPVEQVMALPSQSARGAPQGFYYRVQRGDTLFGIARAFGVDVQTLEGVNHLRNANHLKVGQRLFIPPPRAAGGFLWPGTGRYVSLGSRGLDLSLVPESPVRASRTGRVAVATRQLRGWGQTVVLDHGDGYLTVYAGLGELLVAPGEMVAQGFPIARAARRTALHFEVRRGISPRDPLSVLP